MEHRDNKTVKMGKMSQNGHYCKLFMVNPVRSTNKETWKKISRWLRICRNKVEAKLPAEVLSEKLLDLSIYGSCEIFLKN